MRLGHCTIIKEDESSKISDLQHNFKNVEIKMMMMRQQGHHQKAVEAMS